MPIYLSTFKYILTTYQMLKDVDFNKVDLKDFKTKSIHISESSTLEHLLATIREKYNFPSKSELRLWLPEK